MNRLTRVLVLAIASILAGELFIHSKLGEEFDALSKKDLQRTDKLYAFLKSHPGAVAPTDEQLDKM